MLRCRIFVSCTWKHKQYPLQCCNKAEFSSSSSTRIPTTSDNYTLGLDNQPSLESDVFIGVKLSQAVFRETSTKSNNLLRTSSGNDAAIFQAKSQSEGEEQKKSSNEATDVIVEEKDREKVAFIPGSSRYLMQKLEQLRLASRNISKVAAAAIISTSNASKQRPSPPSSQSQDSISRSHKTAKDVGSLQKSDSKISRPLDTKTASQDQDSKIRQSGSHTQRVKSKRKTTLAGNKKASSEPKQLPVDQKKLPVKIAKIASKKRVIRKVRFSMEKTVKTKHLVAEKLQIEALDVPGQPPVKTLCYDLDRVLFKQGVYNLQDPRTGVYNFDQYLQKIMPEEEFDFDSLSEFKSSSEDIALQNLAKERGKRYVGSTSSMTSVLSHFHFLLSNFRPLNLSRISKGYPDPLTSFTEFTRIPSSMYLKYKDGVYAIDSDKEFDRASVLSKLGQSLEKLLTVPKDLFEQYRKSSAEKIPDEVKNAPEAYHYSSLGNFVFRSQLDGHHDWLPGSGIFDIKTRACVTIRMDQENYKDMSGYQIRDLYGEWESYEREYLDMLRSTMLKYSLQVRMGRMDGIFVAYHNTEQIFGFQYIPLSEMDLALHGQEDLSLGDQEFKFSLQMLSDILDMAVERFPHQSIRFHFEARPSGVATPPKMYIFAEPMDRQTMDTVQQAEADIAMQEFRDEMLGKVSHSKTNDTEETPIEVLEDSQEYDCVTETDLQNSTEASTPGTSTEAEIAHTGDELRASTQSHGIDIESATDTSETIQPEEKEPSFDQSKFDELIQSILPPTYNADEHLEANSSIEAQPQRSSEIESSTEKDNVDQSQAKQQSILGFCLLASNEVDHTETEKVPKMKYTSEWPLQQAQYRETMSARTPDVDKSWNVKYKILEYREDQAWKLYRACQARRRKKFEKLYAPDEYRERYISMMKTLSERGRNQQRAAEKAFGDNASKQVSS